MKIGIDIDGIILDFERTMRTYAELYDLLILRKNGVSNPDEFDYLDRYDWTKEEKKKFIDDYLVYARVNSTPLIPLIREMLELLEVEGYTFDFITAVGLLKEESKNAVVEVFKRNDLPTENIHWGVKDKVLKCQQLGIDVMVEDKPSTCKLLRNDNIKTLYFRDKGNEKIEENQYLKEISNVGEICRYIFSINGLKNSSEIYQKILLKNRKKDL